PAHPRRRARRGHLVKEHQVEPLALAVRQLPERASDAVSSLARCERVERIRRGLVPNTEAPGSARREPMSAPGAGGHVPHHRKKPGLESGAPVEARAPLENGQVHGLQDLLGLGGVPPGAGEGPGEARRMERSDLLPAVGRCHASGPWDTLAQGFAERAGAHLPPGGDAAVRSGPLREDAVEARVPALGHLRAIRSIAAVDSHVRPASTARSPARADLPALENCWITDEVRLDVDAELAGPVETKN